MLYSTGRVGRICVSSFSEGLFCRLDKAKRQSPNCPVVAPALNARAATDISNNPHSPHDVRLGSLGRAVRRHGRFPHFLQRILQRS